MKTRFFILTTAIWCIMLQHLFAQSTIHGKVSDTVNYTSMAYSAVSLIKYQDSIMWDYTWTEQDGSFRFENVPMGKYRLLISRTSFVDYEDFLLINDSTALYILPDIAMISKANLLNEVIIKEKSAAIRIRGDTTEFLVDSFLTNKNSNVEDLLKKLPGIQVNKNGKITAQGQEVKKVLVDGEEFFGNDPTLATRNIRAEDVEKVQVFDKKSEEAAFTGIDDGEKNKTINLQLKEDAKKGYFGKLGTSTGTDSRYEHEGMMNAFNNKRKLSVFALGNNTNRTQLNWDENTKFGGGNDFEYDEATESYYSFRSYDYDIEEVGVPKTIYSGAHYSDKLNKDKHGINVNLTQRNIQASGFDYNYAKYILPDTVYFNNQLRNVSNSSNQLAFNAAYDWAIDSNTTIKVKIMASKSEYKSMSSTISENLNEASQLTNENRRTNTINNLSEKFSSEWMLMKKFKTKGRTATIRFNQEYIQTNGDKLLNSNLKLYDSIGLVANETELDQFQTLLSNKRAYKIITSYTEPIAPKLFLVSDYQLNQINSVSIQKTNAKNNNEYNVFLDSLSNELGYDVLTNVGGMAIKYAGKKWTSSLGGRVSYNILKQFNKTADTTFNQRFFNLFPYANINYKIKNTSSIALRYNGNTRQPSINQIMPVQDVSNPLVIMVGNPELRQSFQNSIRLNYNTYKPISGRSFYSSVSFSFVKDDFADSDQIDAFGRRIIKTVNVTGNNNLWGYMGYYFELKKLKIDIGFNASGSLDKSLNFINGMQNQNNSQRIRIGNSVSYEYKEKLNIGLNPSIDYNRNISSLRSDIVTDFIIQTYQLDASYTFLKKFLIKTDCTFNIREQTSDFDRNLNTIILNASFSKKFFKNDQMVLSIEGYDLLNQNLGFDRTNSTNYINEHVYSVLKRYVLVRMIWNFTKGRVEQNEN